MQTISGDQEVKTNAFAMMALTGEIAITLASVSFDLFLGQVAEFNTVSPVDFLRDGGDLVLNGDIKVVKELET